MKKGVTFMGNKAGQARRGKKTVTTNSVDLTTYTTERGMTIELLPTSQLLLSMIRGGVRREFLDAKEPIDVPTYSSKTVAGDVQKFPLDEKSLEVKGDAEETERRKAAWAAHQDAIQRMWAEERRRVMRYQFSEGIVAEIPDTWDARMKKLGVEVPEDPDERKVFYIMTELLPTMPEMMDVVIRLTALANRATLSQEMLEAAEATFRSSLRE